MTRGLTTPGQKSLAAKSTQQLPIWMSIATKPCDFAV